MREGGSLTEPEALLERATEWCAAALDEYDVGRNRVAFEAARHAAELGAKSLLLHEEGFYPKKHKVAGELAHNSLLPTTIEGRQLQRFLGSFTTGTYGFDEPLHREDIEGGIEMAQNLITEAQEVIHGSDEPDRE